MKIRIITKRKQYGNERKKNSFNELKHRVAKIIEYKKK